LERAVVFTSPFHVGSTVAAQRTLGWPGVEQPNMHRSG
jgi:hypothetical protein